MTQQIKTPEEVAKKIWNLLDTEDVIDLHTLTNAIRSERAEADKLRAKLKEKDEEIDRLKEHGVLPSDEVTVAFFRKYLNLPDGNLEDLCRKAQKMTADIARLRKAIEPFATGRGTLIAEYEAAKRAYDESGA